MSTEAERRAEIEDECWRHVLILLADDAPLRSDMEGHSGRHLVSLRLDRSRGDAEIVAEMRLRDGSSLTERYGIWTYDTPPQLHERHPETAHYQGFMIAMGISDL
jgi:hypothetical protein